MTRVANTWKATFFQREIGWKVKRQRKADAHIKEQTGTTIVANNQNLCSSNVANMLTGNYIMAETRKRPLNQHKP